MNTFFKQEFVLTPNVDGKYQDNYNVDLCIKLNFNNYQKIILIRLVS